MVLVVHAFPDLERPNKASQPTRTSVLVSSCFHAIGALVWSAGHRRSAEKLFSVPWFKVGKADECEDGFLAVHRRDAAIGKAGISGTIGIPAVAFVLRLVGDPRIAIGWAGAADQIVPP